MEQMKKKFIENIFSIYKALLVGSPILLLQSRTDVIMWGIIVLIFLLSIIGIFTYVISDLDNAKKYDLDKEALWYRLVYQMNDTNRAFNKQIVIFLLILFLYIAFAVRVIMIAN